MTRKSFFPLNFDLKSGQNIREIVPSANEPPKETLAETLLCSLMRIYSNFSLLSTMCDIRLLTMINVHWILDICGFSISDKVSHEIIVAEQRPINDHKSQWI